MNLSNLPVYSTASAVEAALDEYRAIIYTGATGSGKSLCLPFFARKKTGRKVVVSETRRIAATSLATTASNLHGYGAVGGKVGYHVRFHKSFHPDTQVLYATEGEVLIRAANHNLAGYDWIIDEVHERTANTDLLLGLAKLALAEDPEMRLIVASATLDAGKYVDFFGRDIATAISCEGRLYPIEEHFEASSTRHLEYERFGMAKFTAEKAAWLIKDQGERDDILVFLPSFYDLVAASDRLYELGIGVETLLAHGEMEIGALNKLFSPHHRQRVIFATNVAETSLTIPGVTTVIESGLVKQASFNTDAGIEMLDVVHTSQASSLQRAGRGARMCPGKCFYCFTREEFESRPEYTTPEIQRSNISGTLLTMASMSQTEYEHFPFIDPPNVEQISHGVTLLNDIGALDESRAITSYGRELHRLPLDPMKAHILKVAERSGALHEVIVTLALMDTKFIPRRRQEDEEPGYQRLLRGLNITSDPEAYLILWQEYMAAKNGTAWAKEMGLNWRALREAEQIVKQLTREATGIELEVDSTSLDPQKLKRALINALPSHVIRESYREHGFLVGNKTGYIFPGSFAFEQEPALLWYWEKRDTSKLFLQFCIPLPPQVIQDLFPEEIVAEVAWPTRADSYLEDVYIYNRFSWRGHPAGSDLLYTLPVKLCPIPIEGEFELTPEQWQQWIDASAEYMAEQRRKKEEEERRKARTKALYVLSCSASTRAGEEERKLLQKLRDLLEDRFVLRDEWGEVTFDSRHIRWDAEKRLDRAEELFAQYEAARLEREEYEFISSPEYQQQLTEYREELQTAVVEVDMAACPFCGYRFGSDAIERCSCLVNVAKTRLGLNNGTHTVTLRRLVIGDLVLAELTADYTPGYPAGVVRTVHLPDRLHEEVEPEMIILQELTG